VRILWLFLGWLAITQSQAQNFTDLRKLHLVDMSGEVVRLPLPQDNKPLVILFLEVSCPISQKYMTTVREFHKSHEGQVNIIGIFQETDPAEVKQFKEDYALPFDVYQDKNQKWTEYLDARVTPEVFLLDPSLSLIYRGAIDNWFYELGRYRKRPTELYLNNALEAFQSGDKIKFKETEAVGCIIQRRKHVH